MRTARICTPCAKLRPSPTFTVVAGLTTRTVLTRTAPAAINFAASARDLQKRACQSHLSRRMARRASLIRALAAQLQRGQSGEGAVRVDRLLRARRPRHSGLVAALAFSLLL